MREFRETTDRMKQRPFKFSEVIQIKFRSTAWALYAFSFVTVPLFVKICKEHPLLSDANGPWIPQGTDTQTTVLFNQ